MLRFEFLRGHLSKIKKSLKLMWECFIGIIRILKWYCNRFNILLYDAGQETGILALSLTANRHFHLFERTLWGVIVICSIYGAIMVSDIQIRRYINSPTLISVDRDYRGWNGSLPAVTLCYHDHIDSYKANQYIQENWNATVFDEDYFYFMDFINSVVNASANNYADLARFSEDERFDDVDLFDLVRSIDRPFDQVLTSFDANFEVQILPVMTERGGCYAINSPMSELLISDCGIFYSSLGCKLKLDLTDRPTDD